MDLIDRIQAITARLSDMEHIQTEEATKNALVMPFINALGYNVFDPTEVVPEFTADVGIKKGEKVDYAIMQDGKTIMLIECKTSNVDLHVNHLSQLFRYFTVTDARFGILTNGLIYHFYSDLDTPNRMDDKPFFVFDIREIRESQIEELKKFTRSNFDVEQILTTASSLKYTREFKRIIAQQLQEPDEEFMRFFASQVFSGRFTPAVKEEFNAIVKQALRQFINDQINERLQSALSASDTQETPQSTDEPEEDDEQDTSDPKREIVTTQEEIEGYLVVKSILREVIDAKRITIRDTKSYCGVLLDDTNRKPICRLHFNRSQKYLGLIDAQKDEDRVPIETVDDIYQYADKLKATIGFYEESQD